MSTLAIRILHLVDAAKRRGATPAQIQSLANAELAKYPRAEVEAAKAALVDSRPTR
ncbi:hypothetical protein H3146_05970 [Streptomyces sp. OF3]|uniref:Uncharacterized protein n=1 Tax=Streptomyces alkaliterrae TaxID=2213162 RepID=A0A7W3WIF9_9ACTN|nr:hypothetical protein [Streptomyces alkaliterrae]MBB1252914.1 hypothetical protein [Streptomyces alkaliterrae]